MLDDRLCPDCHKPRDGIGLAGCLCDAGGAPWGGVEGRKPESPAEKLPGFVGGLFPVVPDDHAVHRALYFCDRCLTARDPEGRVSCSVPCVCGRDAYLRTNAERRREREELTGRKQTVLVVLEGFHASGKSTLTDALAETFRHGTRFPLAVAFHHTPSPGMKPYRAALHYAAQRAAFVECCTPGALVFSDRWYTSTEILAETLCGREREAMLALARSEREAHRRPDLVLVCYCGKAETRARLAARGETDWSAQDEAEYRAVLSFHAHSESFGVDTSGSPRMALEQALYRLRSTIGVEP